MEDGTYVNQEGRQDMTSHRQHLAFLPFMAAEKDMMKNVHINQWLKKELIGLLMSKTSQLEILEGKNPLAMECIVTALEHWPWLKLME